MCAFYFRFGIGRQVRKVGFGLIILHMPSENCNNAHVTELQCVFIGNFRFSNRYQSEEHEMALFKV